MQHATHDLSKAGVSKYRLGQLWFLTLLSCQSASGHVHFDKTWLTSSLFRRRMRGHYKEALCLCGSKGHKKNLPPGPLQHFHELTSWLACLSVSPSALVSPAAFLRYPPASATYVMHHTNLHRPASFASRASVSSTVILFLWNPYAAIVDAN